MKVRKDGSVARFPIEERGGKGFRKNAVGVRRGGSLSRGGFGDGDILASATTDCGQAYSRLRSCTLERAYNP